ncbi:MAG: YibE/F family protein [Candidatus Paceibacterota bacterium]
MRSSAWIVGALAVLVLLPSSAGAQSVYEELQDMLRAEVVEVTDERESAIPGTGATTTVQTVSARIGEGEKEGDIVTFENDLVMLAVGDDIFLSHIRTHDGIEFYILKDVNRQHELLILVALFVLLLVGFAGWQGLRAISSLMLSIGAILFILVPALLAGYDPVLVSLLIASVILAIALFGTHGVNPRSVVAFAGTVTAVIATSIIAWLFVDAMRLTGFGSDASVYLNFATGGSLDFSGLLLGSIIIGILGILDDVSITQASVVQELKSANEAFGIRELYGRAIRVGRDHVGSLVNTLALAYVGAALPLVLLFSTSEAALTFTLNQEVIAAELARIIIGSIGIILAVPFTTLAAAWWFDRYGADKHDHGHHHHHH